MLYILYATTEINSQSSQNSSCIDWTQDSEDDQTSHFRIMIKDSKGLSICFSFKEACIRSKFFRDYIEQYEARQNQNSYENILTQSSCIFIPIEDKIPRSEMRAFYDYIAYGIKPTITPTNQNAWEEIIQYFKLTELSLTQLS